MARAKYMPAEARKRQIAEVTVELIASSGVQAATISRIAEQVEVSESALYRHFESRHQILLAAMDLVYEFIADFFVYRPGVPVPEQLLHIGRRHTSLVASERYPFFDAFIELLATSPVLGLRQELAARQLVIIDKLADILKQGIADGTVRPEVDPELVSWELHGIYWSEDITHLMGLRRYMEQGFSHALLTQTVERISAPPDGVEKAEWGYVGCTTTLSEGSRKAPSLVMERDSAPKHMVVDEPTEAMNTFDRFHRKRR